MSFSDLIELRKLLKPLEPFFNKRTWHLVRPKERSKRAYGIIKVHKQGKCRPIVSGIDTCTSGTEKYLQSVISKLVPHCIFSLKSTKDFKTQFEAHKHKFDPDKHCLVSFDAISLYTNVNVNRTVSWIINKLYENPDNLRQSQIDPESGDIKLLEVPPKKIIHKLLMDVLLKFNVFRAGDRVFRQTSGLVMGNSLSSPLSNIFCHLMEKEFIEPRLSKEIIFYRRYVDDCICILEKNSLQKIFKKNERI